MSLLISNESNMNYEAGLLFRAHQGMIVRFTPWHCIYTILSQHFNFNKYNARKVFNVNINFYLNL